MSLEERVIELETRLTFQEDSIQALSDELARQQKETELLRRHITALLRRQEELQGQLPGESHDEPPPPHY